MPTLPTWTEYTATVGADHAAYLEKSGIHLGGLRIVDLGDGRAAFDAEAVEALERQPADADGCVTHDDDGLHIWIGGDAYPLNPADA